MSMQPAIAVTQDLAEPSFWSSLRFVRAVLLPGLPWLCLWLLPAWPVFAAWLPFLVIHAVIPIIDWVAGDDPDPPRRSNLLSQSLPLLCLPSWLAALVWSVSISPALEIASWLGLACSMGAIGGVVAINAAHELIHRSSAFERSAGAALLVSVCYGAFKVEHVRGHHIWVGTDRDTASAVRGQSLYAFIPKSIIGTVRSAWHLEAKRLQRSERSAFSLANECVRLHLFSVLFYTGVGLSFGLSALAFVLLVALLAIVELEIINYIEHYGLRRVILPNGLPEPVTPRHSWNANSRVINAFLFNLQRHSDHHAHAGKRYAALRSPVDAPSLPAGYGAMILLALFPGLWKTVMDHRLTTQGQND
jgi:alkane 1-monooxygenase